MKITNKLGAGIGIFVGAFIGVYLGTLLAPLPVSSQAPTKSFSDHASSPKPEPIKLPELDSLRLQARYNKLVAEQTQFENEMLKIRLRLKVPEGYTLNLDLGQFDPPLTQSTQTPSPPVPDKPKEKP